MKHTKPILIIWIFIALALIILAAVEYTNPGRLIDISVSQPSLSKICPPLDSDGDTIVELNDFANFAKVFNQKCEPANESEFLISVPITLTPRESDLTGAPLAIAIGDSDVDYTDYNGVEVELTLPDSISEYAEFTSLVGPAGDSWLPLLGTCVSGKSLAYDDDKLCYAISRTNGMFDTVDHFGTAILTIDFAKIDGDITLLSEVAEDFKVSLEYSDGEKIAVSDEIFLKGETDIDNARNISVILTPPKEVVGSIALNLDLEFENALIKNFEPGQGFVGFVPCEEYENANYIIDNDHICISAAKNTQIIEEDNLGVIVLEVLDANKAVKINFGEEAKITDGDKTVAIEGTYKNLSSKNSMVCGYVDMDGNGTVNLNDFSRFARVYNKSCLVTE